MTMHVENIERIARLLGAAKREGSGWRCLCPAHSDRRPSLSLTLSARGKLLVKCWNGCNGKDVMREIHGFLPNDVQCHRDVVSIASPVPMGQKLRNIERLWRRSKAIRAGDLVGQYLRQRGLRLPDYSESLRFCPEASVYVQGELIALPAMVARFDSPGGKMVQAHRTFLSDHGTKADIEGQKRFMPSPSADFTRGGAVRLQACFDVLGIAEGIETALACHLKSRLPVWATCSAGNMERVIVPDSVREIVIFADNDKSGAGQLAAQRLGQRLSNEGKRVQIAIPPQLDGAGRDWLDIFANEDDSNYDRAIQF